MTGSPLTAADLARLRAVGIDDATIGRAGLVRVSHCEAIEICGIRYRSDRLEGVAFPYVDPRSGAVVTWRVRRDHPERESDGRPIAKYLSPPDRRHLYFPPDVAGALVDPAVPAIVVEAEKSVLAITVAAAARSRPVLALACGGCWGWRGTIGKVSGPDGERVDEKGPLPDFDLVVWGGRAVTIVFDANVATNGKVQAARATLAGELLRRGAKVKLATLPAVAGVNGPDDYLGKFGPAAFFTLVDGAPRATRSKAAAAPKATQGREVTFEVLEPWPDPVDGAALLEALVAEVDRYIATLSPATRVAIALWIVHTYTLADCTTSPYLAISSPVLRCGKTRLLTLLGALVPRRLFTSHISPSALFRTIEKYRPTLLIDEGDTFVAKKDNDELRGLLNSGHTRSTAEVIRAVGEEHEPRRFSTWCAKAIALLGKLPATLADRSIEIALRRRAAGEGVARLRLDQIDADCLTLRRQALRWVSDHGAELAAADPELPAALHDRACDNWRPLLALADLAGGDWPARARAAACALSTLDDDTISTLLLRDIRDVFQEHDTTAKPCEKIGAAALLKALLELEGHPWADFWKGRPLSSAKLARLLRDLGIKSGGRERLEPNSNPVAIYRRDDFGDAWRRYLNDAEPVAEEKNPCDPGINPAHRHNANKNGPEAPFQSGTEPSGVCRIESEKNSINTERCAGVPGSTPGNDVRSKNGRF
jgi:putative DNA primase/helicase